MTKLLNFLRSKSKYLAALLLVMVVVGVYFLWPQNKNGQTDTLVVKKSDFVQTVSISGKVIPAQSVELGFNRNGKIVSIPVEVGQNVASGQLIAQLDARDAKLSLENAKLALAKLTEAGTTQGLTKTYEESLASVNDLLVSFPTVLDGLDQMLNNYTVSVYKLNLPNDKANNYYKTAVASWSKAKKSYDQTFTDFQKLGRPINNDDIVKITEAGYQTALLVSQATKDSYTYVNYVYNYELNPANRSAQLIADRTSVIDWVGTVDTNLTDLGTKRNTLRNVPLDIRSQELGVEQYEQQYEEHFLRAPFSGIITRLDIKNGEQAIAGQATVSMINSGAFQIESFVPEISIANLKIGNLAQVTLDAYGQETLFEARVISIDPAETIRDGVSTYKVKLQFNKADSRIKSGMTASLVLTTQNKSGVISIPADAIITEKDNKFVQIKKGDQIIKQSVTLGLMGALGQTEILSGLNEGDIVILKPQID